jgi:hypothetical protein
LHIDGRGVDSSILERLTEERRTALGRFNAAEHQVLALQSLLQA